MSENGPQFNEYQRDAEKLSWQDLPVYAKELLLDKGNAHEYDNRIVFDHRWIDPDTDDSIYVSCINFQDNSLYTVSINKGDEIGNIRKYTFFGHKQGICVYDANGNIMEEEQQAQIYLECYLGDRLRTSGTRDFEISHEGNDQFWLMAASEAILSQNIDDTIRSAMCADPELRIEYNKYIVDTISSVSEYSYIPKAYLFTALSNRERQIISHNQLES